MSVISVINDDPNVRLIGKYSYNNRFCLGEGAYGKVFHQYSIKIGISRKWH